MIREVNRRMHALLCDFKSNCLRLCEEVLILPGTPFEVLQRHKAIIKEAARLTIKYASSSAVSLDIDQKIYWSMTLLRYRHDLSFHSM